MARSRPLSAVPASATAFRRAVPAAVSVSDVTRFPQNSQDILAWLRYILCRLQKEASGKVEGCGAPVEAAPADARRHGRPPHRRAALFGFPPLKEEATAQAILTRRTLLRAGASAAVTPLGCIEGASVPIAEAPLHSGIARLDAKARQEGAALRDPGAPPNLAQPPSGCASTRDAPTPCRSA